MKRSARSISGRCHSAIPDAAYPRPLPDGVRSAIVRWRRRRSILPSEKKPVVDGNPREARANGSAEVQGLCFEPTESRLELGRVSDLCSPHELAGRELEAEGTPEAIHPSGADMSGDAGLSVDELEQYGGEERTLPTRVTRRTAGSVSRAESRSISSVLPTKRVVAAGKLAQRRVRVVECQ